MWPYPVGRLFRNRKIRPSAAEKIRDTEYFPLFLSFFLFLFFLLLLRLFLRLLLLFNVSKWYFSLLFVSYLWSFYWRATEVIIVAGDIQQHPPESKRSQCNYHFIGFVCYCYYYFISFFPPLHVLILLLKRWDWHHSSSLFFDQVRVEGGGGLEEEEEEEEREAYCFSRWWGAGKFNSNWSGRAGASKSTRHNRISELCLCFLFLPLLFLFEDLRRAEFDFFVDVVNAIEVGEGGKGREKVGVEEAVAVGSIENINQLIQVLGLLRSSRLKRS